MDSIRLRSNAKINLGLIIKGRRPDGYHLLETLYYPLESLSDEIELTRLPETVCRVEMEGLAEDLPQEQNLCYRAWDAMRALHPEMGGVHIRVRKRIPAGAGLGGGSSNAAWVLRGLNSLFRMGASSVELAHIAAVLGADVPFFIYNRPLLATGIGTELEEFPLEVPFEIRLVTPGIHSSTPEAFRGLDLNSLDLRRSLRDVLRLPVHQWKGRLVNDLEKPVFRRFPELAEIKSDLYHQGAVYASMTGSGSAVFGLFERR